MSRRIRKARSDIAAHMTTALLVTVATWAALISTASGANPNWMPARSFGPLDSTAPQILAFADGSAAAFWSDTTTGVHGRRIATDGNLMGDPYLVATLAPGFPRVAPVNQPAPLTGDLGVVVLDTPIPDGQNGAFRVLSGQLVGKGGPVGPPFVISGTIKTDNPVFDVSSNGNGTATVAWPNYDGLAWSVQERQIDASGAMGPTQTVSDQLPRTADSVEVRGHGDGTATIAWSEYPTTYGARLNLRRVGPDGPVGSVTQLAEGSSGYLLPPRIAAHPDGSTTAVWATGNGVSALYVARISSAGAVYAPERVCARGFLSSAAGLHCLDINSGTNGGRLLSYDVAPNQSGASTVVARLLTTDVLSWNIDSSGQSGPPSTLEPPDEGFDLPWPPRMLGDGYGSVIAMWPSRTSAGIYRLGTAVIGPDNYLIGTASYFNLNRVISSPSVALAQSALTGTGSGSLPIWSVWGDATGPASDPTASSQVYMSRYPEEVSCPAVRMIGVRGSGETDDFGTPVRAFRDALGELTPDVASEYIDYPAVGVGFDSPGHAWNTITARMNEAPYTDSVRTGVAQLNARIMDTVSRCGSKTRFILAGYSQGAQVIGDYLTSAEGRATLLPQGQPSRLLVAVYFGDPKFNGSKGNEQGLARYSSFTTGRSGVLHARDGSAYRGYRVESFCRRNDAICQGEPAWIDAGLSISPHEHYQEFEAYWAANRVASLTSRDAKPFRPTLTSSLSSDGRHIAITCTTPWRTPLRGVGTCLLEGMWPIPLDPAHLTGMAPSTIWDLGQPPAIWPPTGPLIKPGPGTRAPTPPRAAATLKVDAIVTGPGFPEGRATIKITCITTEDRSRWTTCT